MINWNPSPEIFSIGFIKLRWYGLLFAFGMLVGYLVLEKIFKREKRASKELETLIFYMIIAVVLGARLGHVLFYSPGAYYSNPISILKIWEGGLASHGAAFGIILATVLFSRKFGIPFLWLADRLSVAIPFGAACVRLGNLMNSEIIGRPGDMPWAFVFEQVDMIPRHPTQIYEAGAYLLIFAVMLVLYFKSKKELPAGRLAGLFVTLLFSARFIIEFFKKVQVDFENNLILDMGQILSIPLVIFGLFLLFRKSEVIKLEPSLVKEKK